MTGSDLAKMFGFSCAAIQRNLQDLSHSDTLITPQNGGNCLNWVLGHVVVARNTALTLTGGTPIAIGEKLALYQRGSAPCAGDQLLDLATLRGFLDDIHQLLVPALAAMPDSSLTSSVPAPYNRPPLTGSVGDALIRLHYHEGYHNGQIGLLRRMAGKEGAIR